MEGESSPGVVVLVIMEGMGFRRNGNAKRPPLLRAGAPIMWRVTCCYAFSIFARPRGLSTIMATISSNTHPFQKLST